MFLSEWSWVCLDASWLGIALVKWRVILLWPDSGFSRLTVNALREFGLRSVRK